MAEPLRWASLTTWILAWDPFVDKDGLRRWAAGLHRAATEFDPRIRWTPQTDTVTASASYSQADLERCLRAAIGRYAHLPVPGTGVAGRPVGAR